MEHVEVGGRHIAYASRGAGPPLVLLHGILQDSRQWTRQLDALADAFTVVAWDAPGCGGSPDPPATWRMPEYADCLAGLVEALDLERPCLIGLSWGGVLALELCRRRPDLPGRLVLAGAYAGWPGSLPPAEVAARLESCLREAGLPAERFVPGWLPGLLTEAAPQALAGEVAATMADFHPDGYRVMARAVAEADLRDVLPQIAVPTLLLWGEADRRAPLQVAEALHAAIPRSELVALPGVGHLSNMEAPERFTAAVRGFLAAGC
jgi:pimeloyl-ACP methyl ester carboxylesterase